MTKKKTKENASLHIGKQNNKNKFINKHSNIEIELFFLPHRIFLANKYSCEAVKVNKIFFGGITIFFWEEMEV